MSDDGRVVLVGYDGSPTGRAAVDWAARRAGEAGRVLVVHVLEGSPADGEAVLDALVMADDPLLSTSFETELRDGRPADVLRSIADERGADEIVVGARGHGALHRAVLGSVAHDLVPRSPLPVVVIPAAQG
jgi:nucleotide-binding universal stress UspA family protein